MKRAVTLLGVLAIAAAIAPVARADFAVLRSGLRLHITGYERVGDRVRLTMGGGTVDLPATDVVAFEPEDVFPPNPAEPPPAGPFGKFIRDAAEKHGVDEKLITHVIAAESNFNPRAVSRKQALGLMQLLPTTAARYSVGNVFDPAQNIDGGTHYLKDLLERYSGNLALTLAAYNAGPENVERYRGVPPFTETRSYVRRITMKLEQDKNHAAPKEPLKLFDEGIAGTQPPGR